MKTKTAVVIVNKYKDCLFEQKCFNEGSTDRRHSFMTASPSALESQKLEKFYQVNIGGDEKHLHVYVSMVGVNM